MKKSLIALAVAGTFAAPAAFAATANVDVYGRLNISIEDSNGKDVTPQVTDRQSFVGFKGSEDLGGGLKAIWQIESSISPGNTDGVGGASLAGRNSFVGLSGGFGTVLAGRHDTPYKLATGRLDPFADTVADYNGDGGALGTTNKDGFTRLINAAHDHRSNNAVAYISPTWSGFHFAVAGVMTNRNGGTFESVQKASPQVVDNEANKSIDAYSLAAIYDQGPLYLALAYQKAEDVLVQLPASTPGTEANLGIGNRTSSPAWKFGAGYKFGDTRLGFVYEDVDVKNNQPGFAKLNTKSWLVNGVHSMGPISLMAQYGQVDFNTAAGNQDQTKLSLGASYSLSKRTLARIDYTTDKTKNNGAGSLNAWGVQVRHSF